MDKILENDFEDDLTNVVESIMFALGREISAKEIASTLHVEQKQIENSLDVLMEKYNITSGVVLIKVKDSYQLVTNNKIRN